MNDLPTPKPPTRLAVTPTDLLDLLDDTEPQTEQLDFSRLRLPEQERQKLDLF